MKGWYKDADDWALPPARITLDWITVERVALYRHIKPLGEKTPISIKYLPLDELVPMEYKIKWVVRMMRYNRSGGPSETIAEHLWKWLWESWKSEAAAEAVAEATMMYMGKATVTSTKDM